MQLCEQRDFLKRATFYASGVYRNQLKKSEYYDKLRAVYLIALLDFNIFDEPEPVSCHTTCNLVIKNLLVGNIFMTMVELPRFTKSIDAAVLVLPVQQARRITTPRVGKILPIVYSRF
jgi:predicted transposase/invertase (TIGR01784 family)